MYAAVVSVLQTLYYGNDRCRFLCSVGIDHHTLPYHRYNNQFSAGERSVSRRGQCLKREKTVLKISIAIVSAFTMGWLPLSIWWLVYFYSLDKTVIWSCGFQYFTEIVRFFMYSYCAVNPCICFIFIGYYRQGLKNLLSCFSMALSANQVAPP